MVCPIFTGLIAMKIFLDQRNLVSPNANMFGKFPSMLRKVCSKKKIAINRRHVLFSGQY